MQSSCVAMAFPIPDDALTVASRNIPPARDWGGEEVESNSKRYKHHVSASGISPSLS